MRRDMRRCVVVRYALRVIEMAHQLGVSQRKQLGTYFFFKS